MSIPEILLLAGGGLVAVRVLVNLMRDRRNRLIAEVQKQVDEHQEAMKKKRRRQRQKAA